MWFCSSKIELSFRILHKKKGGGVDMLISLLILYFKAAPPELEEFHKIAL